MALNAKMRASVHPSPEAPGNWPLGIRKEVKEPQSLLARFPAMNHAQPPEIQALSALGTGEVGYIKPIGSEADYIKSFFPEIKFAQGVELFALYSADGMPLMISATFRAALENARAHRLATVTAH